MGFSVAQTYLSDVLHVVAQSLLAPDIILLLAFIMYALFSIGSVIAEFFSERRHFKVVMPRFLAALMAAKEEDIPQVIENSGLLKRQKEALNTVYEYRALSGDALVALVRRLVSEEETRYDRITSRNNMAAKVSPMLGLMGTLIPLGPGIQALGTADTATLSSSLLVAFDTTVAGLVTAAVCLVVGKIRSNWYNNYLSALDAAMATMMEKIEDGRATSTATLPEGAEDLSFLFDEKSPRKELKSAKESKKADSRQEAEYDWRQEPTAVPAIGSKVESKPAASEAVAFGTAVSEATVPETAMSEVAAPEAATFEVAAPEAALPEATVTEAAVPEAAAPETATVETPSTAAPVVEQQPVTSHSMEVVDASSFGFALSTAGGAAATAAVEAESAATEPAIEPEPTPEPEQVSEASITAEFEPVVVEDEKPADDVEAVAKAVEELPFGATTELLESGNYTFEPMKDPSEQK